jgi:DNA-binding NarL/FixJ family response regulator
MATSESKAKAGNAAKARVLIVDDHPIVREGLALRINRQADLAVCGEAATPAEALAAVDSLRPDLVVLDLSLGEGSGLMLIRDIKRLHPDMPVLVLSMHDEALYARRAIHAGARGYIMKREGPEGLIVAMRQVLAGMVHLSEAEASRLLSAFAGTGEPRPASPADDLSNRELEVFDLIGHGLGTRQIAEKLHVSTKTVEKYRELIKDKLGISNAAELSHRAFQWVQEQQS